MKNCLPIFILIISLILIVNPASAQETKSAVKQEPTLQSEGVVTNPETPDNKIIIPEGRFKRLTSDEQQKILSQPDLYRVEGIKSETQINADPAVENKTTSDIHSDPEEKKIISKEAFESLPDDAKKHIENNPNLYIIK